MAGFNIENPPNTKNPEDLCRYLQKMCDELKFVLQNIDSDNLCSDLEDRIKKLENKAFK